MLKAIKNAPVEMMITFINCLIKFVLLITKKKYVSWNQTEYQFN